MKDIVITGATRGIGKALAFALAGRRQLADRLVLLARDETALQQNARVVREAGTECLCVTGDLSTVAGARKAGEKLAEALRPSATLVQNAGMWPSRRELTEDGLERSFAVNCVGPLLMQEPLIAGKLVDRIMVVSAGLLVMGRYSPDRTPTGEDFSSWRTYCNTKLAFAVAEREISAKHPDIDFMVLHPGVVRTDLGARGGPLGLLLRWGKRFAEKPEDCASRLVTLLQLERWSPPGDARWWMESEMKPWPGAADDERTRRDIRVMMERYVRP